MAYYTGYVTIPHSTYDEFRAFTNGNGFNYDNHYGCQCYDLAVEFWWNVGFPMGYPLIASSSAYTMWSVYKDQNCVYNGTTYFRQITNLNDVKRGDVIVYNYFSSNPYGHVGFADQDYDTWHSANPTSYEFPILSENNGGTPDPQGGAYTNVHGYDTRLFLGAFRYIPWEQPVPPTPTIDIEHQFPWVLYARKFRNKRKR